MAPLGLPNRTPCDQHLHHRGRCFLPFLYPDTATTLPTREPEPDPPVAPRTPRLDAPAVPVTSLRERRRLRRERGMGMGAGIPLNEFYHGVRVPDHDSDDGEVSPLTVPAFRRRRVSERDGEVSPMTVRPPCVRSRPQLRCQHTGSWSESGRPTLPVPWRAEGWNGQPLVPQDGRYGIHNEDEVMRDVDEGMERPQHLMAPIENLLFTPPPQLDAEALGMMNIRVPLPLRQGTAERTRPVEHEQVPVKSIQASFLNDRSDDDNDAFYPRTPIVPSPSPYPACFAATPSKSGPRNNSSIWRYASASPTAAPQYPWTPSRISPSGPLSPLRQALLNIHSSENRPTRLVLSSPTPFGVLRPAADSALEYTGVPARQYVGNGRANARGRMERVARFREELWAGGESENEDD